MEKKVAGWLIVHTEGTEHVNYELYEGKNIIGRSTPNFSPDIPLDDTYVSRKHAVMIVRLNENNFYEYYIADNDEVNGKPSMNGTFVNGKTERIGKSAVKMIDGDTVQIGVTKFVLKSTEISIDIEEAIKLVKKQEYQTTVDFVTQSKLYKKIKK
ncbi:MAG: FHA domain-containing protein [Bacteroidales bacterium]|nr:FHA domain-containing protein [Bacteroidales bacterium]